jgi:hypothetical protein
MLQSLRINEELPVFFEKEGRDSEMRRLGVMKVAQDGLLTGSLHRQSMM